MISLGKAFDKLKKDKFPDQRFVWFLLDIIEIIIDIAILLIVFYILFDIRLVPTGSMEPNVKIGDRVFFEKPSAYLGAIHRGDVVMFDATEINRERGQIQNNIKGSFIRNVLSFGRANEVDYLKRVIGVGGDRINIRSGQIFINGKRYKPKYDFTADTRSLQKTVYVKKGYVFVMGDNRPYSYDSRFWGELSIKKIKAKAIFGFNIGQMKFKWLR